MTLEADVAAGRAQRLCGAVAIVTGATGGVGMGIVRRLVQSGAQVVAVSRDAARARAVADELAAHGGVSVPLAADVGQPEEVDRLVAATVERFGRLDVMVNNAAVMHLAPLMETRAADLARVLQVNVGGVLAGLQAATRQMTGQGVNPRTGCRGKIVNVSSPAADNPNPLEAAYGASKAAVNHLTRTAAAVVAPDLISVTALYPGNVWEGMQGRLHRHAGDPPGDPGGPSARAKLDGWPTGRWQRPDDTGDLVVFVAAFEGMGLNGELIVGNPHRQRL